MCDNYYSESENKIILRIVKRYKFLNSILGRTITDLSKKKRIVVGNPIFESIIQSPNKKYYFVNYVNHLIRFHIKRGTPGLSKILTKEAINGSEFYHSLSQMELAKTFINKGFKVEIGGDLILNKKGYTFLLRLKHSMKGILFLL